MFDLVSTRPVLAVFVLGAAASACSSGRDGFVPGPKDAGPVETPFVDAGVSDAAVDEPSRIVAEENKLVYALSRTGNELHRFDPKSLKFTSIGKLSCPTSSGVLSMAVDRRGIAWVVTAMVGSSRLTPGMRAASRLPFDRDSSAFRRSVWGSRKMTLTVAPLEGDSTFPMLRLGGSICRVLRSHSLALRLMESARSRVPGMATSMSSSAWAVESCAWK